MKRFLCCLIPGLAAVLNGCTMIDMSRLPPADWPELKVTIKDSGYAETQEVCGSNVAAGLLFPIYGCASVDFDSMTCTIYLWSPDKEVLEHELEHCNGRDHIGASTLRDAWEEWKNAKRMQVEGTDKDVATGTVE